MAIATQTKTSTFPVPAGTSANPHVKEVFTKLIKALDYAPLSPITDDNITFQALMTEFAAYNTGPWFEALCRESATMAELPYANHSPEVRRQIARYTWFLIYVDDLGQKFPDYLLYFQKRVLTKDITAQGDFLQAFQAHLTDYYHLFDPIPANCINLSAMDFINGCLLEQMPEIQEMEVQHSAQSWPYFLRNKTGSAQSYAFMIFPSESGICMTTYIQVLEDITLYTNLINDILSFYKEDLAGERNNYIYNRAYVSKIPVHEALQDTVDDVLAAHARITKVLESTPGLPLWEEFVNGYFGFHFTLKRYKLHELELILRSPNLALTGTILCFIYSSWCLVIVE